MTTQPQERDIETAIADLQANDSFWGQSVRIVVAELVRLRAQSEGAQAKVVEHDWHEIDGALTCSRCGLGYTNIQCISPPRQTEEKTHE